MFARCIKGSVNMLRCLGHKEQTSNIKQATAKQGSEKGK